MSDRIAFFGAVTAGISHELKNALATINELSGLEQDLLMLHRKRGKPLDPDRLAAIGQKVQAQVQRGEELLTALNRFAHSVDHPEATVDPGELLGETAQLCQRAARLQRARLVARVVPGQVKVTLDPFALHRTVILAAEVVLRAVGEGEEVSIGLEPSDQRGPTVVVEGGVPLGPDSVPKGLKQAADDLGADVWVGNGRGGQCIRICLGRGAGRPGRNNTDARQDA